MEDKLNNDDVLNNLRIFCHDKIVGSSKEFNLYNILFENEENINIFIGVHLDKDSKKVYVYNEKTLHKLDIWTKTDRAK